MEVKEFSPKISSFPLIAKNTEVQKLIEEIRAKNMILLQLIIGIQGSCAHTDSKNTYQYPNKIWEDEKGAILAKECVSCGFTQQKPKGSPEVVCDRCWGAMKHVDTVPGKGERTFHYECKVCTHQYSHT